MKTSITNNKPSKREVKVALPFLISPTLLARIRRAAAFEEMSVEEYLLDGIKRDLALSKDLMAAAAN